MPNCLYFSITSFELKTPSFQLLNNSGLDRVWIVLWTAHLTTTKATLIGGTSLSKKSWWSITVGTLRHCSTKNSMHNLLRGQGQPQLEHNFVFLVSMGKTAIPTPFWSYHFFRFVLINWWTYNPRLWWCIDMITLQLLSW